MRLVWLLIPLLFTACLKPPQNLAGQFEHVSVHDAQAEPKEGVPVRWGGTLVSMKPETKQTCFEIAAFPLDSQARPRPSDQSPGRFIACAPGFFEPTVYTPGRDITIVGVLHGTTVRKVGQYDYTFPRVDATAVHLWPERSASDGTWHAPISIGIGGVFWHGH